MINLLKYSAILLYFWLSFASPTLALQQRQAPRVAEQRAKFEHTHPVPSYLSHALGKAAPPDFRTKRIDQQQRIPADWRLKYSPAGALLWAAQTGGAEPAADYFFAMATDAEGHVYVTGSTGGYPADYLTVKYSPDGEEL